MARVMDIADQKDEAADTMVVEITTVVASRVAAAIMVGGGRKEAVSN